MTSISLMKGIYLWNYGTIHLEKHCIFKYFNQSGKAISFINYLIPFISESVHITISVIHYKGLIIIMLDVRCVVMLRRSAFGIALRVK